MEVREVTVADIELVLRLPHMDNMVLKMVIVGKLGEDKILPVHGNNFQHWL